MSEPKDLSVFASKMFEAARDQWLTLSKNFERG